MDARRAALRVPVDEVIRSFLDHCEERPLYLRPLVEYYSQPEANSGAAPDRADLLRYLIDRAVDDNPDPALVGGERQAPWTALRDLAESLIDELTLGVMFFSLAHSNERRQLAVGTHSGRVRLCEFADQASLPTPMGDFVLPCGDIVRSLFFLDGGNALLVVSWAGSIHVWSIVER